MKKKVGSGTGLIVRGMDPGIRIRIRIRIHTKMSRIPNIAETFLTPLDMETKGFYIFRTKKIRLTGKKIRFQTEYLILLIKISQILSKRTYSVLINKETQRKHLR